MGRRGGPDAALLKGITLSDDQRARLAELRQERRAALEASREAHREAMQGARDARASGDTAAFEAQMGALRQQMTQAQEQHLASVRRLLTPPQQTQFDANVAEWTKQRAEHDKQNGRRGRDGRRPQHDRSPR